MTVILQAGERIADQGPVGVGLGLGMMIVVIFAIIIVWMSNR